MLEYSSLDIVKQYVQMHGIDLKDNFEKFNLLDNIKGVDKAKKSIKLKG